MTIIVNVTDLDELTRYEKDFELIARYIHLRIQMFEYPTSAMNAQRFEESHDIWMTRFPEWIRDLLTKEIE